MLGFYGISPAPHIFPNDGRGIGRVVREVYPDGSFGPIYFIRYNRHAGWNENNTAYPYYKASPDAGFVAACEALLADKLITLQWWEEDRSPDGFYAVAGYKALSYYHLPDGRVVGLWKWSKAAISDDEGHTWSPVVDVPTLVMAGAKIWGQRTSDGRYALVYNPSPDNKHRWPLAVVTGDNGTEFDTMLLVNGEVPPRRFKGGAYKDYGTNYVRGIVEGNGVPPDGAMWVTYSMNKEDIWVSRVPVPVRYRAETHVHDTFNDMAVGGIVTDWNVYSPQWAPVSVVPFPGMDDKSLELRDADPYDYAKAERVFPERARVTATLRVMPMQADTGQLHIEIADGKGSAPFRLLFDGDSSIKARNGGQWTTAQPYAANTWYEVRTHVDATRHRYSLVINGETAVEEGFFAASVRTVERLLLRTGPRRREPTIDDDTTAQPVDLPGADEPSPPAVYYVNEVRTE